MKVGIVLPGGLDRHDESRVLPYLHWLVERLARRHELHIYAIHPVLARETYPFAGATVHAPGGPLPQLRAVAEIVAEHRRRPFDVLHAFWAHWPGTVAGIAGGIIGRPVLLHLAGGELVAIRDIGYGSRLGWRGRAGVRFALRAASRVSAASGPMRALAATMDCAAVELPLGIDLARWPVREPARRKSNEPARLLHVGSINRVKDHATLFAMASRLRGLGVRFHLDLAGDDILNGEVHALAVGAGVAAHVEFHGHVPRARLRELMEHAHVLLVSSRHEAGPVAMLEAAVAGVPTVGTDVGHVHDWAPDAAVAVPVQDDEALAREVAALLSDEGRRLRLARAAQRRAVATDADWTADRVDHLYAELAGRNGGRRAARES